MKAILEKKVNCKGLGDVVGLYRLNPVFESKEEWLDYNNKPTREQIREVAMKKLEEIENEESKAYYGEEALFLRYCIDAEEILYSAYFQKQSDLEKKAERIESGYVFLTRENNIDIHDTAYWNLGLFISKEVAIECLDEVLKFHGNNSYPIIARDENGNEIDLETEREAE